MSLVLGSILKAYSTLPKIHNKSEHVFKKRLNLKVCAFVQKKNQTNKKHQKPVLNVIFFDTLKNFFQTIKWRQWFERVAYLVIFALGILS